MLTVNQPIMLAQSQSFRVIQYSGTYNLNTGLWDAQITYVIQNELGAVIERKTVDISVSDYNNYWTNFTNGEFLVQKMKDQEQLNVPIPQNIEDEFINPTQ